MNANQRKSRKSYPRQKSIIAERTPHQPMLILGGHIFRVMHLLCLREAYFKKTLWVPIATIF
jgi:hypothetical protein